MKRNVDLIIRGYLEMPTEELTDRTGNDPAESSEDIDEAVEEFIRNEFGFNSEFPFDIISIDITRLKGEVDDLEDPDDGTAD